MTTVRKTGTFIDRDKLRSLADTHEPSDSIVNEILNEALKMKGLGLNDVAALLNVKKKTTIQKLLEAAGKVKEEIYGKRIVLFAPLYTGNQCSNNCLYCGFRKDNKKLERVVLNMEQIGREVGVLLKEGHKRVLLICGESEENPPEYYAEAVRTAYAVRSGPHTVRRINVELAPMEVSDFTKLKNEKIGTYVCFQETYDPELYRQFHPSGPKADYEYRLSVMDRAMKGGIDDVGIGALFGLGDHRFEVLAMMEHARHLERKFGCGPHTVSVPRIEPADGAPLSFHAPNQVSDDDFKKIVAIIRLALPYTGIILSTRETSGLRDELFRYGISQISAGSRTNPGAYSDEADPKKKTAHSGSQFSLGDHRTLDEVISELTEQGYIPSFCTGCYRKGRVGNDFMDLAKPGLIKEFCMPNGIFTFQEYLMDFAGKDTKKKGLELIGRLVEETGNKKLKERIRGNLVKIGEGQRDLYF
jgi:2-iminoacetate synthase